MPAPTIVPALKGKRICLDPGHPSEVGEGTTGRGISEIAVAWQIATRLEKLLKAEGALVKQTKSREREKVTNKARALIANAFKADIMVRLHCDSDSGTGTAVYYPDRVGKARDGKTGPTSTVLAACKRVAVPFHAGYVAGLNDLRIDLKDKGLLSDVRTNVGGKQGALTGSIYSEVPVVLIELCVLTNPHDEAIVANVTGQEKIAHAILQGILRVFTV
jgi:N-acetylmuramoyl-L-alanine amidase